MEASPPPLELPRSAVFRKYYTDNDFFVSPEGILKITSAIVCAVAGVVYLSAGACAGAPALPPAAAAAALASGLGSALLYAGVVLDLPLYAPQCWLFTDIVMSTVMGVLLLVVALLGMAICEASAPLDYAHGPLALAGAALAAGSGALSYARAMRLWDVARARREPPRTPRPDHDA